VPTAGGIDFAPLAAIIGLYFVQRVVILDWLLNAVPHA
jgi:uncharacterized protein YggT (Ycf19 family)